MQVREIMETDVPTVTPDQPVEDAIRLLREHDLPGVCVVNDGGRCVGIITENDLVISDEQGDLHLPHYIELFGGVIYLEPLKRFEERLRKAFASRVSDMMTEDPITVDADADVEEAARLIARHRHNRLPVSEHGRFVGVVTRLDVLEALHGER
ncbi:MAG TPA: CBS domain-containing protein [Capillimicrobium sp.]|nr:CBS domain-containing protein [Capillimicrobium sp.]